MASKKSTRKNKSVSKTPVQTSAQKAALTRAKNQRIASQAAAERQLKRLARNRAAKKARAKKRLVELTKNIEAVSKQGKRGAKNIEKNLKASSKAITKIKAIFKPKKKAAPKRVATKQVPKKLDRATLEEVLDPENYFTYDDFVQVLLENQVQINASLKKGERFVAEYYFGQTKKSYPTIQGLISRLNEYDATKRYGGNRGELGQELIQNIKIHRIESDRRYVTANKKRLAEIEKQKDVIAGGMRKTHGTTTKEGRRKKLWELAGEEMAARKAAEKVAAEKDVEIARLKAQLKKKGKK